MIGNEEDYTACLGFEVPGNAEDLTSLNLDGYKLMLNEATKVYTGWKAAGTTLREVKTATVNVNYGAAHGALAMTTPGDTSMARKPEVEALMSGQSARVKR